MKKTFYIYQKLNYHTETVEKQVQVDSLATRIRQQLLTQGFEEVNLQNPTIDYVFSIGGDGTMLCAMRDTVDKKSVVVGVHAGTIGFLPPYSMDNIENVLLSLNKDNFIQSRTVAQLNCDDEIKLAVNEFTISTQRINQMIDVCVEIKSEQGIVQAGTFRSQAIVVSTPSGSTAYNKNVGGTIIEPTMKCLQLVQVAPTTLSARPFIVAPESTICLKVHGEATIFVDGHPYKDIIKETPPLEISLYHKEAKILLPKDWNFYDVLNKKIHWNTGQYK